MRTIFSYVFMDLLCCFIDFLLISLHKFEFKILKILMDCISVLTSQAMLQQSTIQLSIHKFQEPSHSMNRFYTFLYSNKEYTKHLII